MPYVGFDPSTWSGTRLDEAFAGYLRAYEAAWRPFPDVEPCLRAGVLSNSDQAQQQDKVIRTGLDRYLDVVLTSGLLGVAKPDAGVFEAACRRWGVAPQKVMYVGDRLEVDAVAAGAAGLRGIWLDRRRGGSLTAVETITTLVQLPALVSRPGGLGGAADA